MQNYQRIYDYIHEYQKLIYDVYSKFASAFLTTYYNINKETTVWDNEYVSGGMYERVGDLTGLKWNKYLLLPIFYIEDVTTVFAGEDIGFIKENETTLVFPSTYGIQPYPGDIVKFEQSYLRPTNDTYPIFVVTNLEKSVNTDRTFWRMKVEIKKSEITTRVDKQVSDTFVFFDYTKKIYPVNSASFLTKMLSKNERIKSRLKELYDENSGFYFL